jgi:oligoribonuclease NrnB/cAMP/cGMP phosphodiesterase (DHH superfamily)
VRRVCIYHAGCPDGFGAAFAAWQAWGEDGFYVARGHDDALRASDYRGDHVVFADIAPPQHAWAELADEVEQLVVVDHHISARDRYLDDASLAGHMARGGHTVHFDLTHSGAALAWEYLHPERPLPSLLAYVEDQDLWRFALPKSREVNAAIGSHQRSFEIWGRLAETPVDTLAAQGEPILRAQRMEVDRSLAASHAVRVGELRLEAVNARTQRAEIGHELAERGAFGTPAGAVYRLSGEQVHVSLYSVAGFDVSKIAAGFGGGGHRSAAGFTVSLHEWTERFLAKSG